MVYRFKLTEQDASKALGSLCTTCAAKYLQYYGLAVAIWSPALVMVPKRRGGGYHGCAPWVVTQRSRPSKVLRICAAWDTRGYLPVAHRLCEFMRVIAHSCS